MVGDGMSINLWHSLWYATMEDNSYGATFNPITNITNLKRSDILLDNEHAWGQNKLVVVSMPKFVEEISKLQILPFPCKDCLIWKASKLGDFFVESAYLV